MVLVLFLLIDIFFFSTVLSPPLSFFSETFHPPPPARNPATRHLRVALADASPSPDPSEPLPAVPGLRVSTLTPASIAALRRAGAWRDGRQNENLDDSDFLDLATVSEPFHSMQVWDEAGGCVRYGAEDGLGGRGRSRSPSPSTSSPSPSSTSSSSPPPLSMGSVAENEAIVKALLASVRSSPAPPTEFFGCGGLEALSLPKREERNSASSSSSSLLPLARLSFAASSSSSSSPQISARLVVGADGARSAVRALSGVRSSPWGRDYGAAAVVATVRLEREEEGGGESEFVGNGVVGENGSVSGTESKPSPKRRNVAWQRFLSTGPLALLPLRDGYWSVVWSTTPDHARELSEAGAESPERFAAAVDLALRRRGEAAEEGETAARTRRGPLSLPTRVLPAPGAPAPRAFPLRRASAGAFALPRLALIGDAAHSVHPLGGQGVNLGLADASCLAQFLAERASQGNDPGNDVEALERAYGRPRRAATEAMGVALDGLQRVFGPQSGALAEARAAALKGIDGSRTLRSAIVRYAMGL